MTILTNSTLAKHHAIRFAECNDAALARLGDMIFYYGELGMQEFRTAELLTGTLERAGFELVRNLSGFPTGFMATFGSGEPVIALHCEFDGNPGNSQVPGIAERKEIVPGAPGHCEGHNLNAAVTMTAALAIKSAMDSFGLPGTLKVFGAPAEEQLISRPYFVRDGHFDDVDIAFHAHVLDEFKTEFGLAQLGMMSVQFTFLGMSAHSAMSPWEGRDALDAAVLMDVGMAQFREHMKPGMSAHRVITEGGTQPNVIPARTHLLVVLSRPQPGRRPRAVRAGRAGGARCRHDGELRGRDHRSWPASGRCAATKPSPGSFRTTSKPSACRSGARTSRTSRGRCRRARGSRRQDYARVDYAADRAVRADHGIQRLRRRILGRADGPRLVSRQYSACRPSIIGRPARRSRRRSRTRARSPVPRLSPRRRSTS